MLFGALFPIPPLPAISDILKLKNVETKLYLCAMMQYYSQTISLRSVDLSWINQFCSLSESIYLSSVFSAGVSSFFVVQFSFGVWVYYWTQFHWYTICDVTSWHHTGAITSWHACQTSLLFRRFLTSLSWICLKHTVFVVFSHHLANFYRNNLQVNGE